MSIVVGPPSQGNNLMGSRNAGNTTCIEVAISPRVFTAVVGAGELTTCPKRIRAAPLRLVVMGLDSRGLKSSLLSRRRRVAGLDSGATFRTLAVWPCPWLRSFCGIPLMR